MNMRCVKMAVESHGRFMIDLEEGIFRPVVAILFGTEDGEEAMWAALWDGNFEKVDESHWLYNKLPADDSWEMQSLVNYWVDQGMAYTPEEALQDIKRYARGEGIAV